ncbi:MAG: hypothetical protein ABL994_25765, partial [Verrucomicrobiales bacterium]
SINHFWSWFGQLVPLSCVAGCPSMKRAFQSRILPLVASVAIAAGMVNGLATTVGILHEGDAGLFRAFEIESLSCHL